MTRKEMIEKLERDIESIRGLRKGLECDSRIYCFYLEMEKMVQREIEKIKTTEKTDHEELCYFYSKLDTYIKEEIERGNE